MKGCRYVKGNEGVPQWELKTQASRTKVRYRGKNQDRKLLGYKGGQACFGKTGATGELSQCLGQQSFFLFIYLLYELKDCISLRCAERHPRKQKPACLKYWGSLIDTWAMSRQADTCSFWCCKATNHMWSQTVLLVDPGSKNKHRGKKAVQHT